MYHVTVYLVITSYMPVPNLPTLINEVQHYRIYQEYPTMNIDNRKCRIKLLIIFRYIFLKCVNPFILNSVAQKYLMQMHTSTFLQTINLRKVRSTRLL